MDSVLFHPGATVDYKDSLAWYRHRSLRAAYRFEAEVERILAAIVAQPDSYPRYDDEHRYAVLRKYPFSLVYLQQSGLIYVIAVAHASRSEGYWRKRKPRF